MYYSFPYVEIKGKVKNKYFIHMFLYNSKSISQLSHCVKWNVTYASHTHKSL